jgi:hypothetical protein
VSHARTPVDVQQQPSHVAPWVACDPNGRAVPPNCYPHTTRLPQTAHFSFAVVRRSARAFRLQGVRFRTPSPFSYRVEAAGIEPASS